METSTKVVAIDPSLTRIGVTIGNGESVEVMSLQSPESGMLRLWYYRTKITQIMEAHDPDIVVYEGYAMGFGAGRGRFFDLGELGGVLKLYLYEAGFRVLLVPPSCLKKFMTGKGNADKEEVRKAAARHRGRLFRNLDESDAYGLYIMGLAYLDRRRLPRHKNSFQHKALAACEIIQGGMRV